MSARLDSMDGTIWLNGHLVAWNDAEVHVLTHALHYASSVFEGQRIYDGAVFALEAHIHRLARSAELIGFTIPYSATALMHACRDVVAHNDIAEGYMRPIAWRGVGTMGVSARDAPVNVAIAAWSWPNYFAPNPEGIQMTIGKWRRPDPATAPVHAKAAGVYMIGTMAKEAAENAGFDDALLLDWRGRIAEATGANVFFVRDGVIHTPVADCFLDGITKQTVVELAKARQLKVVERTIEADELGTFDECFLTGSAAEVTLVGAIDDHRFAINGIGEQLRAEYLHAVRQSSAAPAPGRQATA